MKTMSDDVDRMLGSWFEQEARADGAAVILEAVLDQTHGRRPRPAWAARLHDGSLRASTTLDQPAVRRAGYLLLAALLVAAVVVAALLAAGQRPPRHSEPLACVGADANLCGHTAGAWSSQSFLPGLTLTWPNDEWYSRDLPDRLELKALPMTSAVVVQLDPVPAGPSSGGEPGRAGDVASLVQWLRAAPGATVEVVGERTSPAGLVVTTLDFRAVDPRSPVSLLVGRANPAGAPTVEANHYAQRLHLVDLGGGHVLSILVVAYDSNPDNVLRTDATFRPILDSVRPPAWPTP
jgi:hypothetical protein